MLTRLSTRFPCVLAESPAGYRVSASSVQCIPFPKTVVWRRYVLLVAEAEETKQALSGPTDRADSTCFLQMLTQKSTKFISTLRRSPVGTAWSDSRDSHNHKETANPVALSSWGLYLWATGTVSRAACGCLQERKHMSAFATS